MILRGKNIFLRYPTKEDCDILLNWENDPDIWFAGDNKSPYSRKEMQDFLMAGQDLDRFQQARYMICLREDERALGCIDLFDFNKKEKHTSIGVLVYDKNDRGKGYAQEAISLLSEYIGKEKGLKEIISHVDIENLASIRLFEKAGFDVVDPTSMSVEHLKGFKTFKKILA